MNTLGLLSFDKQAVAIEVGGLGSGAWFNAGFHASDSSEPLKLRRGRAWHYVTRLNRDTEEFEIDFIFTLRTSSRPFLTLPSTAECENHRDIVKSVVGWPVDLTSRYTGRFTLFSHPRAVTSRRFLIGVNRGKVNSLLVDGYFIADPSSIAVVTQMTDEDPEPTGNVVEDIARSRNAPYLMTFTSVSGQETISETKTMYQLGTYVWATSQDEAEIIFTMLRNEHYSSHKDFKQWFEATHYSYV